MGIAVAWSESAKNDLKNVYSFCPNQLIFARNPHYPKRYESNLPALEGKTSF